MQGGNKPDTSEQRKCTECTNIFTRAKTRGRPRLTCSEECRRSRASLQRRNQGTRSDPNTRHGTGGKPQPRRVAVKRERDNSRTLPEALKALDGAKPRLEARLKIANTLRWSNVSAMEKSAMEELVIAANNFLHMAEAVLEASDGTISDSRSRRQS